MLCRSLLSATSRQILSQRYDRFLSAGDHSQKINKANLHTHTHIHIHLSHMAHAVQTHACRLFIAEMQIQ